MLRPIVDDFASSWPTDVLRPSDSLWESSRAADRGRDGRRAGEASVTAMGGARMEGSGARDLLQGARDRCGESRVSMLVRLEPGTDYPPHRHGGVEELHLLAR